MKKAALLTNNLGCERHLIYTAKIEKYLSLNGFEVKEDLDDIDLVVYSACGFHNVMKEKVINTYNKLKENKFNVKDFIIMGCLPDTYREELNKEVDGQLVFLHNENELDDYLNATIKFSDIQETNLLKAHKFDQSGLRDDMFFIKVSEGCLCMCSYCIINRAKGYIKSFPKQGLLEQFKKGIKLGYRKIFLTAEDVFAYGYERNNGENIIDLLDSMLSIDNNVVFYFNYIKPLWFDKYSDYIYELCKKGKIGMLWTPMQHINSTILEKMGRPVNFETFYGSMQKITTDFPDIYTSTDIILGFPGESEEIFMELVDFFKKDKCFKRVYHFGYGDIKGTKSYNLDNKIDPREIGLRWEKLKQALGERSPYNQPDSPAFQFGLNYDHIFCLDTYREIEEKARFLQS